MKINYYLMLTLLLISSFLKAQTIDRNVVILEIGTGTWCVYCPGAAKAADQLIDEGKSVAVIENHNGDTYANNYSNARNTYYNITGFPTGVFDGLSNSVGGAACPSGNIYSSYLPLYNQKIAVPSPISVCFSGNHTGDNYTITVKVTKTADYTGSDLRLHFVLTESHIVQAWQSCMTELNFVNRLMVPDQNGTSVSFAGGNTQTYTLNFTKQSGWNAANCEVVAFVQDNTTKEIFNGAKCALNAIPASLFTLNDFTANVTTGCTPFSVNFTTSQLPSVSINWSFEGGSPASSTSLTPTVGYNNQGTFDVVLTGTDGVCFDSKVKTDYISAFSLPVAPNKPTGTASLCINPASNTYTVPSVPNATSYNWELTPAGCGTATPSGNSCLIDWNDTFEGIAGLKVQAVSSCGTGPWSGTLYISIDPYPAQCAVPAGPALLCANSANTTYTTPIVNPATNYMWNLNPSNAGTFYSGSNTIDIDWAETFTGTATLTVTATNNSCEGLPSEALTIEVQAAPAAQTVTGGGTYCGATGGGLPVGLSDSESGIEYELFLNGTTTGTTMTGTGNAISFGNQTTGGTYTVKATNAADCEVDMTGNAAISIDPAIPATPATPDGPVQVFTSLVGTSDYSTTGATYATGYSWELTPAEAGIISNAGLVATATWNSNYSGIATVKVQGVNTCGSGTYSETVETQVNVNVGNKDLQHAGHYALTPVPASGFVTINSDNTGSFNLAVYDMQGNKVLASENLNGKSNKINISTLSSGIYNVVVNHNGQLEMLKLVVK